MRLLLYARLAVMGDGTPAYFGSPLIPKITLRKRLGLSRKRKSSANDASSSKNSPSGCDKAPTSPTKSPYEKILKLNENSEEVSTSTTSNEYQDENSNETPIDCGNDIEIVKKRIREKEEKLKIVQNEKKGITDLVNLFELWKDGCKSAYLHFVDLVKEKQQEGFDHKEVLQKLGIWETMVENFGNDSDLYLLESN